MSLVDSLAYCDWLEEQGIDSLFLRQDSIESYLSYSFVARTASKQRKGKGYGYGDGYGNGDR